MSYNGQKCIIILNLQYKVLNPFMFCKATYNFEITLSCDAHYYYHVKRNYKTEQHQMRGKLETRKTAHQSKLLNSESPSSP